MNSNVANLFSQPEFWFTFIHKAAVVVLLFLVFIFLLRIINKTAKLLVEKQVTSQAIAQLFHNIFKWLIIVLFFLLILQQIGLSISSIWTILSAIIAMIAIGFVAVWSILSNILCTLMLLIFRPFRVGDDVEIVDPAMTSGIRGIVQNINLMFTTLKSNNENEVIYTQVPNNLFFQKLVRRKVGEKTYNLEKQIFEERSLLNTDNTKK